MEWFGRFSVVVVMSGLFVQGCSDVSDRRDAKESSEPTLSGDAPAEFVEATEPIVAKLTGSPGTIETGEVFQKVCATCHGDQGEGKPELKTPAIAGLPDWYVTEQTGKFRSGLRGAHPEDLPGQMMRAIAVSLTPDQILEAARYNEELPPGKTEMHGDKASVDRGRYIFANECMKCHRFNGKGEVVFHSAPLITLNRDYLVRQLKNYRNGRRGNESSDLYGQKMVEVAGNLTDESIEDVVNFIGALAHGDDPRPAMEF